MRKTQKNAVHRVDIRESLEKLGLLKTKNPGQALEDGKKVETKSRGGRQARWM